MRNLRSWTLGALLIGLVFLLGAFVFKPAPGKAQRKTVVVELFTSEGCSSCPPADELLGRMNGQESANGATVIPLGFHVDYWNSLGWQDRFSSRSYSERQQQYAEKFKLEGPYTPQMVVDGTAEFVGNSSSRAQATIAEAATRPQQADIQLSAKDPGKVQVQATLSETPSAADVMLAITEDNLITKVGAGENDGKVLHHAAVVRDFRRLGRLSSGKFDQTLSLHRDKEWNAANLHVVVFVQATDRGVIEGAVSTPWNSLAGAH
ncbi:MAG TPA: DUF1223 domain-containing protein [Candidatus Angelobacter sp.]|nr:DUF1223 domain-containing protein [Candidatus Angelobacter sp.]